MSTIEVDDVEYYYELHGEGHPLILVGGYTTPIWVWEPLVEQLKDTFQLLVFDNQGVGQTKDHGGPLSAEDMADGIVKLAAALDLKKPHVAGLSMGGTIAQRIGLHHGDKIDKLALIVTSPKWRQAMLRGLGTALTMREKELEVDDIFSASLSWAMGEEFLLDPKRVEALKQKFLNYLYPQSLEDQKRQYEVLKNFDGCEDLQNIQASTLILYTQEDVIALPYEAKMMADQIPHAVLIECPGGHGIILENPNIIAGHIKQFL